MARPRKGLESFHSTAPADWPSYRNRVGILTKERVFRLSPKAIIIEERDKDAKSIAYTDINKVHLNFVKTKYRTYVECDIRSTSGDKYQIRSVSYEGFASFEDHDAEFRNCMGELHEKRATFPRQRAYRKGSALMWGITIVGMAAMVGMAVFAVVLQKWIVQLCANPLINSGR